MKSIVHPCDKTFFNDLFNVSKDKPCYELSTPLPSKAFIASAYSIEVLSLGFLLASVTLILKMGSHLGSVVDESRAN